jgi:hypothetical protein
MAVFTPEQARVYKPQATAGRPDALPYQFENTPFTLVHYPQAWQYHDEHGFIPDIGKIVHKPGANGVEGHTGRPPDPTQAITKAIRKGGTVLSPGDRRLGEWANYLISYPVNGRSSNAQHYALKTAEFNLLPGGSAKQRDTSGEWFRFLAWMRDQPGLLHTMPETSYELLLGRAQERLERMVTKSNGNTIAMARIEAQQTRIAAMEVAWVEMNGAETVTLSASSVAGGDVAAIVAQAEAQLSIESTPAPTGKLKRSKSDV